MSQRDDRFDKLRLKPLVEKSIHTVSIALRALYIYTYIYIYLFIYIFIYIYIYI